MADERSGFLGRWSRRKTEALQGRALDEPVVAAKPALAAGPAAPASTLGTASASTSAVAPALHADAAAPTPEKPLSLDDVKALTQNSDFKPFMARNVGADVRNAAMKKLFADPHYNVMDGLDIYIDDYSIADPLPQAMLKQMASAKFLNLFDDEEGEKNKKNATARAAHSEDVAHTAQEGAAAQADAMPAPADDSLTKSHVQNLNQSDVQSLNQPDAQSMNQSDVPSLAQRDAQNLIQPETNTAAHCAEPSMPARADFTSSLSADHASQPEPAPGSGASQDNHAHSHLRLQPDHAAPAPNAGRGT